MQKIRCRKYLLSTYKWPYNGSLSQSPRRFQSGRQWQLTGALGLCRLLLAWPSWQGHRQLNVGRHCLEQWQRWLSYSQASLHKGVQPLPAPTRARRAEISLDLEESFWQICFHCGLGRGAHLLPLLLYVENLEAFSWDKQTLPFGKLKG